MNRSIRSRTIAVAAVLLGAVGLSQAAHARTDVYFSVGIPAAPVYVQPEPVYVQPAPAYVTPAPVYAEPEVIVRTAPRYYVQDDRGWRHEQWRRWQREQEWRRWHHRHEGRDWD